MCLVTWVLSLSDLQQYPTHLAAVVPEYLKEDMCNHKNSHGIYLCVVTVWTALQHDKVVEMTNIASAVPQCYSVGALKLSSKQQWDIIIT